MASKVDNLKLDDVNLKTKEAVAKVLTRFPRAVQTRAIEFEAKSPSGTGQEANQVTADPQDQTSIPYKEDQGRKRKQPSRDLHHCPSHAKDPENWLPFPTSSHTRVNPYPHGLMIGVIFPPQLPPDQPVSQCHEDTI